jgi:hypothetical protein
VHHRGVEVVCNEPGHLMTVTQEVDAAGVLDDQEVHKECHHRSGIEHHFEQASGWGDDRR